jgi:hypothetical protein
MSMRQALRLTLVVMVMMWALLGGREAYQGIPQGTSPAWAADEDRDKERGLRSLRVLRGFPL